jgi:hypothetical protein
MTVKDSIQRNVVLIVDDAPDKRRFLRRAAQGYLDPRDWEVIEVGPLDAQGATSHETLSAALSAIQHYRDRLAIAIVHASLSEEDPTTRDNKRVYEGLQVLDRIAEVCKEPQGCYKILVSTFIKDRHEVAGNPSVDDFVYLRYQGDRNPVDELQAAIRRGVDLIRGHLPAMVE